MSTRIERDGMQATISFSGGAYHATFAYINDRPFGSLTLAELASFIEFVRNEMARQENRALEKRF